MFHLIILTLEVCSNDSTGPTESGKDHCFGSSVTQACCKHCFCNIPTKWLSSFCFLSTEGTSRSRASLTSGDSVDNEHVNWAWTSCLRLPRTLKALQGQSTQPSTRADEHGEEQLVLMSKGPRIKACVSKEWHWVLHMLAAPHPGCHSVFFSFGFYQVGTGR